MLITTELEESLAESLCNQKERSIAPRYLKSDVEGEERKINPTFDNPYYLMQRFALYSNHFNTIGEFEDRILDMDLSQIQYPNELIEWQEPRTIRFRVGTFWSKDLRDTTQFSKYDGKGLNINEWNQILYSIRAIKKVTTLKNMTTLDQLKKNVALTDIEDKCICGGKVHYQDTAFVPIKIKDAILKAAYDMTYFSHSFGTVLKRWISEMKWTSNRD